MEKETKYIDLYQLNMFPEDLLLAKVDIEEFNNVEERQPITEFIKSLAFNNVFSTKGKMIAFSIIEGKKFNYVLYSFTDNTGSSDKTAFDGLKSNLEKINYDLTKLTKKSNQEIISTNEDIISDGDYFLIGNNFYV